MSNWTQLADDAMLENTKSALEANGFNVIIAENSDEAKKKALNLVPEGVEAMTMTSVTLDSLGIPEEINESGNYDSVRKKIEAEGDPSMKQKLGAAPDNVLGSVHAVTQDGHIFIASNTGSQLPAHAYGSQNVVLVVGTQKIVENDENAMKRIHEHSLPLESKRAQEAYGVEGSSVSKILIMNEEVTKDRITVVFVKEELGF